MIKRRAIRRLSGIALLSLTALLSPALPPAAAAQSECPSGYLCFWADGPYRGAMGKVRGSNAAWGVFPQSACPRFRTWNDCASSLWNRTSRPVRVFRDANFGGGFLELAPGQAVAVLSTGSNGWNDAISSNLML